MADGKVAEECSRKTFCMFRTDDAVMNAINTWF